MKVALADMLVDYEHNPRPELARTIVLIRDEIAHSTLFRERDAAAGIGPAIRSGIHKPAITGRSAGPFNPQPL